MVHNEMGETAQANDVHVEFSTSLINQSFLVQKTLDGRGST